MLKNLIENSNKIVIFTGAGVSTLSGITDFRSENNMEIYGDPVKYSNIKYLKEIQKNFIF